MQGDAAVVGVGESIYYRAGRSPHDAFQLACIAIRNAVDDGRVTKQELNDEHDQLQAELYADF